MARLGACAAALVAASLLAIILILPGSRGCATRRLPAPDFSQSFNKTDVMIPMRDGVRLHTEIYAPKDATEKLPLLLERTPYGLRTTKRAFRKCSSLTAR